MHDKILLVPVIKVILLLVSTDDCKKTAVTLTRVITITAKQSGPSNGAFGYANLCEQPKTAPKVVDTQLTTHVL